MCDAIKALGPSLPFYKLQGSGNDFVAIDNRTAAVAAEQMPAFATAVCRRAFGVGADGIFFLELPPAGVSGVDYVWQFFNADGSRAEMCGNGSRCAARLAYLLGIAPAKHTLGTDVGPVAAHVLQDGQVQVQLTPARDMRPAQQLELDGSAMTVHFVNTGVPHAIVFVDDVASLDLPRLGKALRYHPAFAPAGTNANFAQVTGPETILLRTYERGVEGETYACGTGASATAYVAHALGMTGDTAKVTTSGGELLTITLDGENIFLTGGAQITFCGNLLLRSVGLG